MRYLYRFIKGKPFEKYEINPDISIEQVFKETAHWSGTCLVSISSEPSDSFDWVI
jgi:hypothetical protein